MAFTNLNSIVFPSFKADSELTHEEAAQLEAAVDAMEAMNSLLPSTPKREQCIYFKDNESSKPDNPGAGGVPKASTDIVLEVSCPKDKVSIRPLVIRKKGINKAKTTIKSSPICPIKDTFQLSAHDFIPNRFLGGGSQGKVYKVAYKNKREAYAIKIVPRRGLEEHEVRRVLREQIILKKIKGAPFVMDLSASFCDGANFYLVTPHYAGGDLQDLLLSWTCFPLERTRFYTAEIVLGLEFLHQRGICHRDLKLSNILLTEEGHIVLADFGLSSDEAFPEIKPSFCGTAAFMAPEILRRRALPGKPSDIWSLGICIWLMRSGKLPWCVPNDVPAMKKAIVENPLPSPEEYEGGFEEEVYDLCQQILCKDRKARPTLAILSQHTFFSGADWNAIAQRSAEAPWLPSKEDENPIFITQMLAKHKFICPTNTQPCGNSEYPGFAYITPEFPLDTPPAPTHLIEDPTLPPPPPMASKLSTVARDNFENIELAEPSLRESPSMRLAVFKFPPSPHSKIRRPRYKIVECSEFSSDSDASIGYPISRMMTVRGPFTSHHDSSSSITDTSSTQSSSRQGVVLGNSSDIDSVVNSSETQSSSGTPGFVRWILQACRHLLSYRI